jgi:hypothetical protein
VGGNSALSSANTATGGKCDRGSRCSTGQVNRGLATVHSDLKFTSTCARYQSTGLIGKVRRSLFHPLSNKTGRTATSSRSISWQKAYWSQSGKVVSCLDDTHATSEPTLVAAYRAVSTPDFR